jgi:hypothetical protein
MPATLDEMKHYFETEIEALENNIERCTTNNYAESFTKGLFQNKLDDYKTLHKIFFEEKEE